MNKNKLILYIAIVLFITNLLLLGFIIFNRTNRPNHDGPRHLIAERLHFDDTQFQQYNTIIKIHQTKIRQKDSILIEVKAKLYNCILSKDTILKDTLKKEIAQLQMDIEDIHYNHFIDLQKICKPDQQTAFDALVADLAKLFDNKRQRKQLK